MTALGDDAAGTGAVVRKPPKNEPAVCEAQLPVRAMAIWRDEGCRDRNWSGARMITAAAESIAVCLMTRDGRTALGCSVRPVAHGRAMLSVQEDPSNLL